MLVIDPVSKVAITNINFFFTFFHFEVTACVVTCTSVIFVCRKFSCIVNDEARHGGCTFYTKCFMYSRVNDEALSGGFELVTP